MSMSGSSTVDFVQQHMAGNLLKLCASDRLIRRIADAILRETRLSLSKQSREVADMSELSSAGPEQAGHVECYGKRTYPVSSTGSPMAVAGGSRFRYGL
jgi:hypothetical protein